VSLRAYGWYFGAFVLLVAAGGCIVVAGLTFFGSLTSLWISIALSVGAIALAIVAWRRYPRRP